jgi:maleylacetoacetate isomerase
MEEPIQLYHYWRSSSSWRVRWALNLKGLPYSAIHINLLEAEQRSPEFLKLNPAGTVPTLMTKSIRLVDSMAILEWLEESYPDHHPLLPKDAASRAYARQLAMVIAAGTQPLQNLKTQRYVSSDPQKQREFAQYWIQNGLDVYEKLLSQGDSHSFSMGSHPTIPDLCLIPQCYNAQRFDVELESFPKISRIYQNALESKPCADAHPDCFRE